MIGRVSLLALVAGSCVQPAYDDRIGVAGVATDPGALAGRFGLASTAADLAQVPLLGEQVGGGMSFALVERSWDGAAYTQTNSLCRVINFEVAGLASAISDATARAIPPIPVAITIDHAAGAVTTEKFYEMWAVQQLAPDDDMPAAPDDARYYDMDGDAKPGATMTTSGLVTGEVYFAQRKSLTLEGVVRGPDEMLGLLDHLKEGAVLGATDDLLRTPAERVPHPDPQLSWWHEIRMAEDAGCDDLTAALDEGSFPLLRPF